MNTIPAILCRLHPCLMHGIICSLLTSSLIAAKRPPRTGEQLDTLRGVNVKADNQLTQQQEDFETSTKERDAVVEEARQNLIPLSRQYMTLAAQADIANNPEGSTTYYRSPDDSALAIEVMNVGGTLQPTGRKMPSSQAVDSVRD